MDCSCKDARRPQIIINEIEQETPFTAVGFFYVGKPTLMTIAGAIVTYIIILIQFDDSKGNARPIL